MEEEPVVVGKSMYREALPSFFRSFLCLLRLFAAIAVTAAPCSGQQPVVSIDALKP